MLTAGTVLSDHYEILSQLGAGGMGEVYRAKDLRLNREVAIKVLPDQLASNAQALSRFEREAKALAVLSHQNIVSIFDFGTENGIAFAVMELLKGKTLRTVLNSSEFPLKNSVDVATTIAEGLVAAHSAGVIHRDLKPENIFITNDGVVKILDFGLARLETKTSPEAKSSIETISRTQNGVVMGTLPYMSPEQVRGNPVDARTDIFSFGCVLFEMLTGKNPFARETSAEVVAAILKDNPTFSDEKIPVELNQVVQHCLEKNPDHRFQSARDLMFGLKSASSASITPTIRGTSITKFSPARSIVFVLVLGIIGLSVFYFRNRGEPMKSLAILPFANSSANPETEYLSDGITESIINRMSELPNLHVMARGTVFTYKGKDVDPRKIGRDLKVEAVVTGRVLKQGDTLIVRVNLVNAVDGTQLWGEQFNRKISDVLTIQDEISREIADKLHLKLTPDETKRLAKHYTESTEAYQLFLKARYYHLKEFTPEDYEKSLKYFQQAIAIDPNYALAYAEIANLYTSMSFRGLLTPKEGYEKGRAAIKKAQEIDDTLGQVHFTLGLFDWAYDWNWPDAEKQFKRSIEIVPNCVECRHVYCQFLLSQGRFDEAIAQMKTGQELNPLDVDTNKDLGAAYFWSRQYDNAIKQYHKTLELDPNAAQVHDFLSDAYARKGMYKEAIAEEQNYLSILGDQEGSAALAKDFELYGYEKAKQQQFQAALDYYKEIASQDYVSPMTFAILHTKLNEKDEAFLWLEKAYAERSPWLTYLNADPEFDSLRSDQRFKDLIKRIGLPQ